MMNNNMQSRCQCAYNNMNHAQQMKNQCGCVNTQKQCELKNYSSNVADGIEWGKYPIAMAYVPWQKWDCVYDAEKGIDSGTIFPELDLEFCGEPCACGMRGDRT